MSDTEDLIRWRRHLHAHPETAFEEVETAKMVADLLTSFGIEVTTGIGGTGVVGVLKRGDGPNVGLRADMDALPIREKNEFSHASTHEGKMHACGHDGHTTMLLGAARELAAMDDWAGTITFIFQPAEENEGGAIAMIEDGLFERFPVDAVFGLHNWPGLPAGQFTVRPGPMMAAYDIFEIRLTGRGAHAAMPHLGTDTLVAAAQLVTQLQTLVSRKVNPLHPAVVSVTQIHGGDTYNVLPAEAIIRGCVRTFHDEARSVIRDVMAEMAEAVATTAGLTASVDYDQRYVATVNTEAETALAKRAAGDALGPDAIVEGVEPSMGSEDFGAMLEVKPGAYVWLGNDRPAGENFGLHHDRYDFNDEILEPGVRYWVSLARRFLEERG
ncbi:M20 aminoacylase family protein [Parvularcula marina]|uniref:M20 aminoacylase family protein n=1 Tax=Parvularcula marina TaxID=2292771 RepID=UPI003511421E